jgi:hypothetical protein
MYRTYHSADAFFHDGMNIKVREDQRNYHRKTQVNTRRYVEIFGIDHQMTSIVWRRVFVDIPIDTDMEIRPCHFLWTLMFLQSYELEGNLATSLGADEKTVRKYKWAVLEHITDNSYRFVSGDL